MVRELPCDVVECDQRMHWVITAVWPDRERMTLYACHEHRGEVGGQLQDYCVRTRPGWQLFESPRSSDLT